MRLIFSILVILILTQASAHGVGALFPVGTPEYRFIYEIIENHRTAEDSGHLADRVGPFTFGYYHPSLPAVGFGHTSAKELHLGLFLSENFRTGLNQRSRAYESVRGFMTSQPLPGLSLYINFLLDEELEKDPDYQGKKWRGFAGEVENAFLHFQWRGLTVMAGRYTSFWGPSRESLILSETARPMDAIFWSYRLGFLRYSWQFAQLDRRRHVDENETVFENRYFSGHRLDVRLRRNLYLGLFETVIFGGPGRSPELAYLNPFLFYHAHQLNENFNDNTFLGVDFAWYLKGRHKIYGQFLIDDFQIDNEVRGDNEPNEIGVLLGIHSVRILENHEIRAEYLAITNRTYSQVYERNRYLNRGELIGHVFGPDGDRARLEISRWLDAVNRVSLNLTYQRRGEGYINAPWTMPWMEVDNYAEPFPTGTVENTFRPAARFAGFIRKYIFLDIEFGYDFIGNYGHDEGRNRTLPYFNLRLSLIPTLSLPLE